MDDCRSRIWPGRGKDLSGYHSIVRLEVGKLCKLRFRSCMAEKLASMGFQSSMADPDVWMRAATKGGDGESCYEYVLMYVDDILSVSFDPRLILLEEIQETFKFTNEKIETPPDLYLGAKLQRKAINGTQYWTITSQDYVKAALNNVEETIRKSRRRLPTSNIDTPMNITYSPEMDVTVAKLDVDGVTYFQELIGMLRLATEIRRVDILLKISLLSQYQASPREGHMEQVMHIFAFLKKHPKITLYMSPVRATSH